MSETDIQSLSRKVDALDSKIDKVTESLAKLNGRFEGGWWVLAAMGTALTGLFSWLHLSNTHIKLD